MNAFTKHYISHNLVTQSVIWGSTIVTRAAGNTPLTYFRTLPAIDVYLKDLISANLIRKFYNLTVLTDNTYVCRVPINTSTAGVSDNTLANITNANIVTNGLQGTTNNSISTNVNPNSKFSDYNKMMCFYYPVASSRPSGDDPIMGCLDTVNNYAFYNASNATSSNFLMSAAWNNSTSRVAYYPYFNKTGFWITGRSGSNRIYLGLTGSVTQLTSSATLAGSYPNYNIGAFAINTNGIYSSPACTRLLSMFAIFDGMDQTEITNFYTASYKCRQLLGGGYI